MQDVPKCKQAFVERKLGDAPQARHVIANKLRRSSRKTLLVPCDNSGILRGDLQFLAGGQQERYVREAVGEGPLETAANAD